jgi:hypothetical protein
MISTRLLCIANEIPLPANSGGRVDIWRRLSALKQSGFSIALLCWYDEGRDELPSAEILEKLHTVCDVVRLVPIQRSPRELLLRLSNLWRMPSHVAARWVTAKNEDLLKWATVFNPDLVFLDGLYGGAIAQWLATQLGRSLIYRSHNIEHLYMRDQMLYEHRFIRRLGLFANYIGLERFEKSILKSAAHVFDISIEDCDYWKAREISHIEWLPTIVDTEFVERLNAAISEPTIDVLYFGNLNTPNNVNSIRWLVTEVLPLITNTSITITLAGSHPTSEVKNLVLANPRVELIENPIDMAEIIAKATVIVNPMLAGSGVNLKSVEMLFSRALLVSTTVGVKGLPEAAKACFSITDNPLEFASTISQKIDFNNLFDDRREVSKVFSEYSVVETFRNAVTQIANQKSS